LLADQVVVHEVVFHPALLAVRPLLQVKVTLVVQETQMTQVVVAVQVLQVEMQVVVYQETVV
jgi:hypothetical protein